MNSGKRNDLNRKILGLALPAIASNITVPLLGLCDTAITGHLGNALYLAAIAAGGTMLNVVYWLCGFLRMGTTGLTAKAYGASDNMAVGRVFSRSMLLAVSIGIFVIAFAVPLSSVLMGVISPDEEVKELAAKYFAICIWGTPALLATLSINGWFVGMQNTVFPMAVSISVNVINIICSLTAVFLLGMGFIGVAVGTLISNWAGFLLAIIFVARFAGKRKLMLWNGWRAIVRGGDFRQFFSVSTNLFFRSACIMGVSLAVTSIGARMGYLTMAVNTVMMQFFILFSYFMDGFAFSAEALCGKYAGAGNLAELRRTVKALLVWSAAIAAGFTLIYLLFYNPVVALLTDEKDVRNVAASMSFFAVLIPMVSFAAFIYDGFFIGLTATRRMLVTTLLAMGAFFLTVLCFHADTTAGRNMTLWTGFLSYLLVRGAGLALQLNTVVRNRVQERI